MDLSRALIHWGVPIVLLRPIILLWIKGDWAEHVKLLGMSSWARIASPCAFCWSQRDNIYNYGSMSIDGVGFAERTDEYYKNACSSCGIFITIRTEAQRQRILREGQLHYVKGDRAISTGRVLNNPIPDMLLQK
eukprot:5288685-Karenia_brevis.AAC.1